MALVLLQLMPQATHLKYEESADTRMAFEGAGEYAETSLSCCGWGLGLGWAGVTARGLWELAMHKEQDRYGRGKGQIIRWYGWG